MIHFQFVTLFPACYLMDDGYMSFSGMNNRPNLHYYIKDHLGSNRIVADENGNIEQKTHYYAYGGIIGDISTNPEAQKYKHNYKEYETMHGLNTYDYGARQYDGTKIVWDRMDQLCEK
ncbi:MAG: hypothetical protein Q3994_04715 [Prevotella sp.]|nr:hypothetical protein [Prevotella sp.]